MALLLPLFGFLCGWGLASTQFSAALKPLFASLLARFFIPIVIIYNMVFYQAGSLWLIGFSFISSVFFFCIFYYFKKDKLRALCLSYLNGAWLGFPFALALFGPQASSIIVALYIGGSLFGNVCAVMAVSQTRQNSKFIIKNVLLSPPVIALSLAAILSIWDFTAYESHPWVQWFYQTNKVLVTFTGMCILGMWLSKIRIGLSDLKQSLLLISSRMFLAIFVCLAAYYVLPIPHQQLTYAVMFMFFALPPAANIVALETYYQGTGHSAKYIASGTIASTILIGIYGVVLPFITLPLTPSQREGEHRFKIMLGLNHI